jgi:hypothetical protein
MADALTGLDEFNAALSRYLVWTSKGQGPATEDRARKVRFELFRVFRKIAKTPQGLIEEISNLGYEFKRRKDPATGKAVSPEKEVALRIRSLRFLSVSWIFKAWRARRDGQRGTFSAVDRGQKTIGQAIVNTAEDTVSPHVELLSFLQGVAVQNAQRQLLDQALRNQAEDMAVYIARKHQEWLQGAFNKSFAVSGVVTIG